MFFEQVDKCSCNFEFINMCISHASRYIIRKQKNCETTIKSGKEIEVNDKDFVNIVFAKKKQILIVMGNIVQIHFIIRDCLMND